MIHPARSDFDATVLDAGVTVTFKPTESIYSFYRLADSNDIARLDTVSPGHVRHAGKSGDTGAYPSDEVQEMALRIASEAAASVWTIRDEEIADELTTVRPSPMVGDNGD
jgi:hypothetical protein